MKVDFLFNEKSMRYTVLVAWFAGLSACGVTSSSELRSSGFFCETQKSSFAVGGLNLVGANSSNLQNSAALTEEWKEVVGDTGVNSSIGLRYALVSDTYTEYFVEPKASFARKNIEFCNETSVKVLTDSKKIIGKFPVIDPQFEDYLGAIHGLTDQDQILIEHVLAQKLNRSKLNVTGQKICAKKMGKTYLPVLQVSTQTKRSSYKAWFDGQKKLLDLKDNAISATGHTRTFKNSSNDAALSDFSFANMQDNSFLCSSHVTTAPLSQGAPTQSNGVRQFYFEPGANEFKETTVFTHVSLMYDFITNEIGLPDWSNDLIHLIPVEQSQAGPTYLNFFSDGFTNRPTIFLTDKIVVEGEPRYQNLNNSFDVSAHELSHHFIFGFISSNLSEENFVLHEALADTFAHAYSCANSIGENPCDGCLAEYTCVPGITCDGGSLNTCLRSADNGITFDDRPFFLDDPHLFSQVFSGLMWDIQQDIGLEAMLDLTKFALQLHPKGQDEAYESFLSNLILADELYMDGAHCTSILAHIHMRNMENFLGPSPCL
jgi:hypothetical protein